jgi:hypothetical protein
LCASVAKVSDKYLDDFGSENCIPILQIGIRDIRCFPWQN